jgi:integrase
MLANSNSRVLSKSSHVALGDHPVVTYIAQLTPKSQKKMLHWLDAIALMVSSDSQDAQAFPWESLRYQHVIAIRHLLLKKVEDRSYSPATANLILSALRGVLKECWRLKLTTAEDYQRAIDFKNIKYVAIPSGRSLSQSEVTALWQVCSDGTALGVRDVALLTVLRSGVRREEAVDINLEDLDLTTGALNILWGKGNKSRTTYLIPDAIPSVDRWVKLRGNEPGPLLLPFRKGGKVEFRRMSPQSVWDILQKRAEQANVSYFTPHDFRRTFVTDLYEAGIDTPTIQELVGHANPATTMGYDRRGEETKRSAVDRLYSPKENRKSHESN